MKNPIIPAKVLLLTRKKPVKLNLGCGTDYKKGWINIDNNTDNNITKLDLNWDLRNPLPFKDGSVDFVYNEHFFEHLTPEEGLTAMQDIRRVLKPRGIMRIAMPDLEQVVEHYLHVPLEDDPVIQRHGFKHIKTRAEWMNMSFREWGHRWLYDFEELQRRLEDAGYVKIRRCKLQQSTHIELKNLETRPESYLIVEATK